MAKRELSSTLKNLKFMQRVAQKEDKAKKEEEEKELVPDGNFPSCSGSQKCVIIMEGDPQPGAIRGRMSFLNFNPSIDKLNDEASNSVQPEAPSTSSGRERETNTDRGDGSPQVELENEELENSGCGSNGDLKRKTADGYEPQHPNKSQKSFQGDERSSPHNNRTPHKQPKREKLDWNVLKPPKSRSKGK
ncbi:unnamed protein product [Coffea canephora]|uniref:M-phase phosphoprotein 6 n=1 Tax=Coffea canephora TaxID=49390 RepID=A0A068UKS9_COFCA|nr:unnamed protein product [Coffea canephora]